MDALNSSSFKDFFGGTTLITDDSKSTVASYFYDVFGSPRWEYAPWGDDNLHKFTGKEFDKSVNLCTARRRCFAGKDDFSRVDYSSFGVID